MTGRQAESKRASPGRPDLPVSLSPAACRARPSAIATKNARFASIAIFGYKRLRAAQAGQARNPACAWTHTHTHTHTHKAIRTYACGKNLHACMFLPKTPRAACSSAHACLCGHARSLSCVPKERASSILPQGLIDVAFITS